MPAWRQGLYLRCLPGYSVRGLSQVTVNICELKEWINEHPLTYYGFFLVKSGGRIWTHVLLLPSPWPFYSGWLLTLGYLFPKGFLAERREACPSRLSILLGMLFLFKMIHTYYGIECKISMNYWNKKGARFQGNLGFTAALCKVGTQTPVSTIKIHPTFCLGCVCGLVREAHHCPLSHVAIYLPNVLSLDSHGSWKPRATRDSIPLS